MSYLGKGCHRTATGPSQAVSICLTMGTWAPFLGFLSCHGTVQEGNSVGTPRVKEQSWERGPEPQGWPTDMTRLTAWQEPLLLCYHPRYQLPLSAAWQEVSGTEVCFRGQLMAAPAQ